LPPNLPEDVAKSAGMFYIDRILNSLGIKNPRRNEVSHNGDGIDGHGNINVYFEILPDGLIPGSIEQTVRDNVRFLAQGIVVSTGELYTRGISGSQKYETVVE